ncbi:MAG: Signal recognition particle core component [Pycnora praestabilis]|nr:MAG: Signal recognition particle core component [Pycnora praestabilis]
MASTTSSATRSLTTLLQQSTINDHEEFLRASNAALKKFKNDTNAQHVKVVALLSLDRYDDALKVFEDGGERLKEKAPLERAYALYKVGNLEKAENLAREIGGSRGMNHIEAQATYRLEKFSRAAELYKHLASEAAEGRDETSDLRINSGATDAQLEWSGQGHLASKKKPDREDLEVFDTAYNAACGNIARGEFGQGEVLLRRAKDLCNALEDLSDKEKTAEILPIIVQQIYVSSMLGKTDDVEKLSLQITLEQQIDSIPDLETRTIAQNNSVASSTKLANPYLSHRIFHSVSALPKTAKPFEFQSDVLRRNSYAIDILSLKYTGVANSTSSSLSKQPSPTTSTRVNTISVLNAAAHAQNQVGKAGLKEILPLLEKRPNDVGLLLTIIQLYLLTNNHGSAISLLESFLKRLEETTSETDQDVRFAPGLVGVLVSLYSTQGRKSHIRTELAKAASYWRRKSKPSPALFRAAGQSLLGNSRSEDLAEAGKIFASLRQQDDKDHFAIAGYVASYATIDSSKITSDVERLTPVSRLISGIDAAALEDAGVPHAPTLGASERNKKRAADDSAKPAKKRVRKARLPKNYDPSKPPDQERWLPLRDRLSYRPKGKKGKQKAAAVTQGGISEKGEESLPLAAGGGKVIVEKAGGIGGGKAKKKSKGGKR